MNTLRIVLIVVGVIFILGIYLFQSRKFIFKKSADNKNSFSTLSLLKQWTHYLRSMFTADEPVQDVSIRNNYPHDKLNKEQLVAMSNMVANNPALDVAEPNNTLGNIDHTPPISVSNGNELLISLTVLPKPNNVFSGTEILSACKLAGLQLGEFNIFHRYALVNNKVLMTPVCSLVNLFEPGYFDVNTMDNFTTEGLSLFMQLPGPVDGRDAFLILMDVSDKLSVNLNATICDETRSVLTTQTISHIKEKVENFRFKLKMDALKNH